MSRIFTLSRSGLWITLLLLVAASAVTPRHLRASAEVRDINPQPDNLIVLRVSGPNGEEARATVLEGGALSILDPNTGEQIAFFPAVAPANRREVQVKVFQGYNSTPGLKLSQQNSATLEKVNQVDISLGSRSSIQAGATYTIEIEAIIRQFITKKEKTAELRTEQGRERVILAYGGDNCCISCNGRLYCSNCSVETPCGCCHTEICTC